MPALAALPVVGLSLFFLWPLGTLLVRVLQPGSVGDALRAPGLGQVLWFTLWQAVASTALTLVVGFAPAYLLARYRFPGRRVLLAAVTVPCSRKTGARLEIDSRVTPALGPSSVLTTEPSGMEGSIE